MATHRHFGAVVVSADFDALREALGEVLNEYLDYLFAKGQVNEDGLTTDLIALLRDPRHARAVLGLIGDVREGFLQLETGDGMAISFKERDLHPNIPGFWVSLGAATKEDDDV